MLMKHKAVASGASVVGALTTFTIYFAVTIQHAFAADATTVFSSVMPSIKGTASFAALAPTFLPDEGATVYAYVEQNTSSTYIIDVGFASNCQGGAACWLGSITGSSQAIAVSGTNVTLSNGATAYFVPGKCSAYCAASTLTWHYGNGYYQVSLRGATQLDLVSAANSMSTY